MNLGTVFGGLLFVFSGLFVVFWLRKALMAVECLEDIRADIDIIRHRVSRIDIEVTCLGMKPHGFEIGPPPDKLPCADPPGEWKDGGKGWEGE